MIDKSIRQMTFRVIDDPVLFDKACNDFRELEGFVCVATTITTQIFQDKIIFIATIFYRKE